MIRGAIGGAVGTWAMDAATEALLRRQSADATAREDAARPSGKTTVEHLVDRLEDVFDVDVPPDARPTVSQWIHYGLGVAPGAIYGALRGRVPLVGAAGGIVYGVLLWALNDEYLATELGLAAPPEAYPPETHLRGLAGHVVLGVTTDRVIDLLGG